MSDTSEILRDLAAGDPDAAGRLWARVYDELRRLAAARLRGERAGQTLQPTALVHEAYFRLVGAGGAGAAWSGRGHFFAAASEAMRRILVEAARRKRRLRHGGGRARVELTDDAAADPDPGGLVELDEALTRLEAADAEAALLVKLRYFGGLSVEEAAEAAGVSRATAYRQWAYARAWLRCDLGGGPAGPE